MCSIDGCSQVPSPIASPTAPDSALFQPNDSQRTVVVLRAEVEGMIAAGSIGDRQKLPTDPSSNVM